MEFAGNHSIRIDNRYVHMSAQCSEINKKVKKLLPKSLFKVFQRYDFKKFCKYLFFSAVFYNL